MLVLLALEEAGEELKRRRGLELWHLRKRARTVERGDLQLNRAFYVAPCGPSRGW
jgi:hypothetical protein